MIVMYGCLEMHHMMMIKIARYDDSHQRMTMHDIHVLMYGNA